ncbi:hypothetical protein [Mycobacteroides immunogenum]|uniref:hypothetical protein n=1 Tax=Mycobacteroides immunogenum TaxID=83262 RepID=UPI0006C87FA5|nr:hypothetical protein [Mycobacteroides immunogenum]MCV7304547.1 hypothetical protein [Mycobacteroides immunogenum]WJR35708.1 hypothetical protein P3F83_10310 [Mycobacteroides immunogenum]
MALSGDCARRRGLLVAVPGLLRALLIAAVLLVPVMKCPPGATIGIAESGRAAVSAHLAEIPHLLAVAVDAGHHHECNTPPVTAAIAAAGAVHGCAAALAMISVVALVFWVLWCPRRRGPPQRNPHGVLRSGRDHLLRLCVMRR